MTAPTSQRLSCRYSSSSSSSSSISSTVRRRRSGAIHQAVGLLLSATMCMIPWCVILLLSASSQFFVHGDFVEYALILEPTEEMVHYNTGYIIAPGFIDVGSLSFVPISSTADDFIDGDTIISSVNDDNIGEGNGDSDNDDGRHGRHGRRQGLAVKHQPQRKRTIQEEVSISPANTSSVLDIVVFHKPPNCGRPNRCNWSALGVGRRATNSHNKKITQWCCSNETVAMGFCTNETLGRLLLDHDKFTGDHREVTIPNEGDVKEAIKYGKMEETTSGLYVVLFANCNKHGREMYIQGETVWKSKHGYLPGELYGFMYFYVSVTIVYFLLWIVYGYAMTINAPYRIEIEKWIMLSISLGLFEMMFRSLDHFVWNIEGYRSAYIVWIGVLAGVLKQGISRCLIVMVSLGWGVVRDTLGSMMRTIILLGTAYVGISAVRDLMYIFAVEDVDTISDREGMEIVTVVNVLTLFLAAIDVIFILWILDALHNTVIYLETMNQTRKLERYNKLRCLFMFSILFATVWAVFTLVDSVNDEGLVAEEHAWAIDAATEVNYLFVLIGVALLWRPNPNAQEYAYVMELSSGEDNGADGENEIELSGVVPSAADGDYDDDDDGNDDYNNGNGNRNGNKGYNDDDPDGPDGRFEIS